jgi:hypothetical protein
MVPWIKNLGGPVPPGPHGGCAYGNPADLLSRMMDHGAERKLDMEVVDSSKWIEVPLQFLMKLSNAVLKYQTALLNIGRIKNSSSSVDQILVRSGAD